MVHRTQNPKTLNPSSRCGGSGLGAAFLEVPPADGHVPGVAADLDRRPPRTAARAAHATRPQKRVSPS